MISQVWTWLFWLNKREGYTKKVRIFGLRPSKVYTFLTLTCRKQERVGTPLGHDSVWWMVLISLKKNANRLLEEGITLIL